MSEKLLGSGSSAARLKTAQNKYLFYLFLYLVNSVYLYLRYVQSLFELHFVSAI